MLTDPESIKIVVDCIRAISHVNQVDINGTLDDAGIIDADRVNAMVTLIVHNRRLGVLSQLHRLSSAWFRGTSPTTPVNTCIDIVRDKSIEIRSSFTEDFASMVASHLKLQMDDSNDRAARPSRARADRDTTLDEAVDSRPKKSAKTGYKPENEKD